MSAGSRTYFCKNGHVVVHFDDDVIAIEWDGKWIEDGSDIPCPTCGLVGRENIRCCFEWGNPDYESGMNVPVKPSIVKPTGKFVEVMETVFDVSKLFRGR